MSFNLQGVKKSKTASRNGNHMPVRTSLLESGSDVEEVTGTEPQEAPTTNDHFDSDTEFNDETDGPELARRPDPDSGSVIPPSEGGLTEDAFLAFRVYTRNDDDNLDEDSSIVADVELAPTVGVQRHRVQKQVNHSSPYPVRKRGKLYWRLPKKMTTLLRKQTQN